MTHSQQPSIDILKKIIASNESWSGSRQDIFGNNPLYFKSINELKLVKKEIEALPQEASVEATTDELLEEINPDVVTFHWKDWCCSKETNEEASYLLWGKRTFVSIYWYWKTPREALLALKEKLPTNQ